MNLCSVLDKQNVKGVLEIFSVIFIKYFCKIARFQSSLFCASFLKVFLEHDAERGVRISLLRLMTRLQEVGLLYHLPIGIISPQTSDISQSHDTVSILRTWIPLKDCFTETVSYRFCDSYWYSCSGEDLTQKKDPIRVGRIYSEFHDEEMRHVRGDSTDSDLMGIMWRFKTNVQENKDDKDVATWDKSLVDFVEYIINVVLQSTDSRSPHFRRDLLK